MKRMMRVVFLLVLVLACHARPAAAQSSIVSASKVIEVTVQPTSQAVSRTQLDAVWDARVVAGHLNPAGIGNIVNPVYPTSLDTTQFALHQNVLLGTPGFVSGRVPNPISSTVMLRLNRSTTVTGIEIIQHRNGANQVAIAGGAATNALTPITSVTGPNGLADNNCVSSLVYDGQSEVFPLATPITGNHFTVTVTGGSCVTGFAIYRMFLLDRNGRRILGR